MKEHPILFNTEMVKAVLDGRKTQTRRVIKPQPYKHKFGSIGMSVWRWLYKKKYNFQDQQNWINHCPHGQVGDRLWVRETWALIALRGLFTGHPDSTIVYKAGPHPFEREFPHMWTEGKDKWKPSIHMFRRYSRINLEITDIRVERAQDMSEEDAWAEGCVRGEETDNGGYFPADKKIAEGDFIGWDCAKDWFADLWDSINDKRGFGWDVNPWVWVVEFKLIKTERKIV